MAKRRDLGRRDERWADDVAAKSDTGVQGLRHLGMGSWPSVAWVKDAKSVSPDAYHLLHRVFHGRHSTSLGVASGDRTAMPR